MFILLDCYSYKPENIQLGEKIMKRRKELDMTAAELADQASISTVTLSGIETGRISPKFDVLNRIAFVLNKPLSYFQSDDLNKFSSIPNEMTPIIEKFMRLTPEKQQLMAVMFNGQLDSILNMAM